MHPTVVLLSVSVIGLAMPSAIGANIAGESSRVAPRMRCVSAEFAVVANRWVVVGCFDQSRFLTSWRTRNFYSRQERLRCDSECAELKGEDDLLPRRIIIRVFSRIRELNGLRPTDSRVGNVENVSCLQNNIEITAKM